MDRAYIRFSAWILAGTAVAFFSSPNFLPLLSGALDDTFGTFLPAIPFATLLTVLFLLRWRELSEILQKEGSLVSELPTRLLGIGIVASLLILKGITAKSVESAGIAVVLAFYGTSLILNPLTRIFMLPYAIVYSAGVATPGILQWSFGEPLAWLSTAFSGGILSLGGLPVAWHGTQFTLLSKTGEVVTAVVTPGCSSIISVTTFLGLLALMHMDLKKELSSTVKIAIAGTAVLILLNAVRIVILIWVGYADGLSAFWGVHNWVGYAMFLGFYLALLPLYARTRVRSSLLR
jgi:exosortase/archaeosortase family protein